MRPKLPKKRLSQMEESDRRTDRPPEYRDMTKWAVNKTKDMEIEIKYATKAAEKSFASLNRETEGQTD